jgi:hypothetical protein
MIVVVSPNKTAAVQQNLDEYRKEQERLKEEVKSEQEQKDRKTREYQAFRSSPPLTPSSLHAIFRSLPSYPFIFACHRCFQNVSPSLLAGPQYNPRGMDGEWKGGFFSFPCYSFLYYPMSYYN